MVRSSSPPHRYSQLQRAQLAELQLLRSSVLPDEFAWRSTVQEVDHWEHALATFDDEVGDSESDNEPVDMLPPFSASIRITNADSVLWIDIDLPSSTAKETRVEIRLEEADRWRVREEDLAKLRSEVQRKLYETKEEALDHPLFDLYIWLQDRLASEPLGMAPPSALAATPPSPASPSPSSGPVMLSRLIIWSHHLLSQTKRRQISSWCSSSSVWGLLKTGYPGYLCFEGEQDDIKEMQANIKAMQWAAIVVRVEQSWAFTGDGGLQAALLSCPLAKEFAGYTSAVTAQSQGGKIRTTCEEVETMKEIVDRLRSSGIPEEEIVNALGLRTKQK